MEMVSKPCQVNKSIPNPGSFNNLKKKENTGSQMGHIKKKILKNKKNRVLKHAARWELNAARRNPMRPANINKKEICYKFKNI